MLNYNLKNMEKNEAVNSATSSAKTSLSASRMSHSQKQNSQNSSTPVESNQESVRLGVSRKRMLPGSMPPPLLVSTLGKSPKNVFP